VGLYTDTSKLKWIFWTSHHLVLLIDMLLKSRRNLSTRKNESLGLQILQQPKYDKDGPNKQVSQKLVQATGKEGSQEDKEGHRKMV
jgi:hypothetical protein